LNPPPLARPVIHSGRDAAGLTAGVAHHFPGVSREVVLRGDGSTPAHRSFLALFTTQTKETETMETNRNDPDREIIDGFTAVEIRHMATDSVVQARCDDCGAIYDVEPDAESYDCASCEAKGSVTSPLIKLGLI